MNLLPLMFQFIFGCHHRHLSRVFTINNRTYQVCFKCAQEIDYPRKPIKFVRRSDAGAIAEPNTRSKQPQARAS